MSNQLPAQVLPLLYDLAEMAEREGSAVLEGSGLFPFNYPQALVYKNYFDGLRRFAQEEAIVNVFFTKESPFYGWGPYVFLEAVVPLPAQLQDPTISDVQKADLEFRRNLPGRLEVHKRASPAPSVAMTIIRATVVPQLVTDVTASQLNARRNRVVKQVKEPSLLEKLTKLRVVQTAEGALIGTADYNVTKLKKES